MIAGKINGGRSSGPESFIFEIYLKAMSLSEVQV